MPFGLCNSAPTFQRLMDMLLSGLLWNSCLVYIDDVIIFSESFEEHVNRLESVFTRFQESGLKLKAKKYFFAKREVTFLGHCKNEPGILPDKEKVSAIKNFPRPNNGKERNSLGTNVRTFDMFKQALTQYPILHYPNLNLPFPLMTDACDTGLGIVLAQQGPESERVVAYASRTIKPNRTNKIMQ